MTKFFKILAALFLLLLTVINNESMALEKSIYADKGPNEFLLCHFSMNNRDEVLMSENFFNNVNKFSQEKVVVREFAVEGEDATKSFRKMIEANVPCDGLVISGHHLGNFYGDAVEGFLRIDDLEAATCDNKTKNWFANIKALWLQGCRTLGEDESTGMRANDHVNRLSSLIDEDNLETNQSEVSYLMSKVFDLDNHLASRFLRAFPKASVFGWTSIAPGMKAQSQRSIPYHIAHMQSLKNKTPVLNPLGQLLSEESSQSLSEAAIDILRGNKSDLAVAAWEKTGTADKMSFRTKSIKGYRSLSYQENKEILNQAKESYCKIKFANTSEAEIEIAKILEDTRLIGFNFDTIEDYYYSQVQSGVKMDQLQNLFQKSSLFKFFLESKINSDRVGTLRKLDYARFYKEIFRDISDEQKKKIVAEVNMEFAKPFVTSTLVDIVSNRNYKLDLLRGLKYLDLFSELKWPQQHIKNSDFLAEMILLYRELSMPVPIFFVEELFALAEHNISVARNLVGVLFVEPRPFIFSSETEKIKIYTLSFDFLQKNSFSKEASPYFLAKAICFIENADLQTSAFAWAYSESFKRTERLWALQSLRDELAKCSSIQSSQKTLFDAIFKAGKPH